VYVKGGAIWQEGSANLALTTLQEVCASASHRFSNLPLMSP
jgi:hypothetical protein